MKKLITLISSILLAEAIISAAATHTVVFVWDTYTDDATGFKLYHWTPTNPVKELVATISVSATNYTYTTTTGEHYWYLTAFNDSTESLPSNTVNLKVKPNPPNIKSATQTN